MTKQGLLNAAAAAWKMDSHSKAARGRAAFVKALKDLEEQERAGAMYQGLGADRAAALVSSRLPALIDSALKAGRAMAALVSEEQERAIRAAFLA